MINEGRPFRVDQARHLGLSDKALRVRAEDGRLVRLVRGVYVDASIPVDTPLRAEALSLVLPPGVAAARSTAAWLLGVPPVEPNAHLDGRRLEVVSAIAGAGTRRTGCRGSSSLIAEDQLISIDGALATAPVRTLLDLVRDRERPHALAYADAFLRAGLVETSPLAEQVERLTGHRGVEQVREIIALADPRAESPGESWLRLRYIDAGFPPATPQLWVCDADGRRVYRLDLGREKERAGVEYDGARYHGAEQQAHDLSRQRWLEEHDWSRVGFGEREVLGRGHDFERVVGEMLGCAPRMHSWEYRRRTRYDLPWPSRGAVSA